MKTLKNFNFKNKLVLVRCDFNVTLDEKGQVSEDFRIKQTIPTIEYLIKKGAKIILMSHFGRPEGKVVESMRLGPIQEKLMEYLDVSITKAKDCIGKEVEEWVLNMKPGEVLLLENLRFHKEEEDYYPPTTLPTQPAHPKKEGEDFAKKLAKLGNIYINDAFSASHRAHASIVGIPKYLPSGAGLSLEKEIKILSKVLKNPWRPLVIIIGGVKISTKIGVISQFLKKADHLLLGGEVANAVLIGKGISSSKFLVEEKEIIKKIEQINITNPKLHLPVDGLISLEKMQEDYFRQGAIGSIRKEEKVFDIGPETIKIFCQIIKGAKMILWSGPLGMFEEKKFEKGTKQITEGIVRNHAAFKIVGGGNTISAVDKFGLLERFDYVSTGGGAILEFLSGEKLPGIEALK